MHSFRKSILAVLLVVVLALIPVLPRTAVKTDAADARTQSLQDQIAALEDQIAEYEQKITSLTNEKASQLEIKTNLDGLAQATATKISTAEALTTQLEEQIAATTARIAEKEEAIKTTFAKFLERLVVSYEEGDASYLSIILGSSDMADFLSKMDMVSSMLEYDRNLKIQYENEKTALEAEKKSLEEDIEYQKNLILELEADKDKYELLSKQQEDFINSLSDDIEAQRKLQEEAKAQDNALNAQLEAMLAEIARRERELQEQRLAQGDTSTPQLNVNVGTGFAWPLPGQSYISSGFGWRTLFGAQDFHLGIDIPAPYGTPIHASKGGEVLTAGFHGSYGNYVVVSHGVNENGDGEATAYAHMSQIGCSAGQYVNQGDVIGYVGSTGNSTGNHLHFEVRINGQVQNPLNFVSP